MRERILSGLKNYLRDHSGAEKLARRLIGVGKTDKEMLSAWEICDVLGVVRTEENFSCSSLRFAKDSRKGCAAIISPITSDPGYRVPDHRIAALVEMAKEQGARLVICSKAVEGIPCVVVDDVFAAYCKLICYIRARYNPGTVAITGSIGKTTATEMTYAVISSKYSTLRNGGSANSVRYAGTVIQRLRPEHRMYVQEVMEGPPYGAAATISKLVQPQCAIVTLVGTSHMEKFGTQKRILDSCMGVQEGMPSDGLLILNGDDPFQLGAKTDRKAVYYGINNRDVDYWASNIHSEGDRLHFDMCYEEKVVPVTLHCFGTHNILNAAAAFAAGKWAGMSDEEIVAALDTYRTSGIRQNLIEVDGYRLYMDCYNAAPESMKSAMDALSMIYVPKGGCRIGVLADVLEVGDQAEDIHRQIGRAAADSCLDILICYGQDAHFIAEEAKKITSIPVYHVMEREKLLGLLKQTITRQDLILFKGSHGMALEQIVDMLWGSWFHEEFERYDFKTRLEEKEGLEFRLYTDHATLEKLNSHAERLIIPEMVCGLPVTGIERDALAGHREMSCVHLPTTLRNVRQRSFANCGNLRKVVIPTSVRLIDQEAFQGCKELTFHGEERTFAWEYAKRNRISFVCEKGIEKS